MRISGETKRGNQRWIRVDLHIHTPASEDYIEPDRSYLEILQEAERRELEVIAFTDHNTVHGYEQMQREIELLEALERAQRLSDEEQAHLQEYRRLLDKITVLPGFEFTSHYGAHILGIFGPNWPISLIEATLLQLGIPAAQLKSGSCSITNTRHVTEAYEIINRAGGIVIAPHANGPSGVITETLRMGTSGQSRVAATQSPHLHALEFVNYYTDHEKFTSPAFYNGRTEHYERRMFCIQGSDAHRLRRKQENNGNGHYHGVGDRYIELLIPDNSFESVKALFTSESFDCVRVPKRDQKQWEIDTLRVGPPSDRQVLYPEEAVETAWKDIAALANIGGGLLIIGCSQDGNTIIGVSRPDQTSETLRTYVQERITPQPYMSMELLNYDGRDLIRIEVKAVDPPPYTCADGVTYIRRDGATIFAERSEIIQLCRQALAQGVSSPLDNGQALELPRSGVQVVGAQRRNGTWHYEVRDLRTTAGVTRDRAQGLWAYAINRFEDVRDNKLDVQSQVHWSGQYGVWRSYRQGNRVKYDLVHRNADGTIDHIFFGVSDWGLSNGWGGVLSIQEPETIDQDSPAFEEDTPQFLPDLHEQNSPFERQWGERKYRWRGRGGILSIVRDGTSEPLFDLAMKNVNGSEIQEFPGVPREKVTDAWMGLIRIPRPRTGIEVLKTIVDNNDEYHFVFCNLRTGEVSSVPWRLQDIEEGTVREYAARMSLKDLTIDDDQIRWWGNIGYLRPMRSQVDLVYRDENGEDHVYYAARRDELSGEWRSLLEEYGEM